MRPIKFRVFDKEKNIFYTGDDVRISGSGKIELFSFYGPDHVWFDASNSCELVRFTGIFDNRGEEIWEDHILFCDCNQCVDENERFVLFSSYCSEYMAFYNTGYSMTILDNLRHYQIIGNRLTTPSLLSNFDNISENKD